MTRGLNQTGEDVNGDTQDDLERDLQRAFDEPEDHDVAQNTETRIPTARSSTPSPSDDEREGDTPGDDLEQQMQRIFDGAEDDGNAPDAGAHPSTTPTRITILQRNIVEGWEELDRMEQYASNLIAQAEHLRSNEGRWRRRRRSRRDVASGRSYRRQRESQVPPLDLDVSPQGPQITHSLPSSPPWAPRAMSREQQAMMMVLPLFRGLFIPSTPNSVRIKRTSHSPKKVFYYFAGSDAPEEKRFAGFQWEKCVYRSFYDYGPDRPAWSPANESYIIVHVAQAGSRLGMPAVDQIVQFEIGLARVRGLIDDELAEQL